MAVTVHRPSTDAQPDVSEPKHLHVDRPSTGVGGAALGRSTMP